MYVRNVTAFLAQIWIKNIENIIMLFRISFIATFVSSQVHQHSKYIPMRKPHTSILLSSDTKLTSKKNFHSKNTPILSHKNFSTWNSINTADQRDFSYNIKKNNTKKFFLNNTWVFYVIVVRSDILFCVCCIFQFFSIIIIFLITTK